MNTIPLSTVIESSLRIKISDVKHIVEAKLSDDEVSAHLDIPQGSPVLYVERDHFYKKRLIMRTAGRLPMSFPTCLHELPLKCGSRA